MAGSAVLRLKQYFHIKIRVCIRKTNVPSKQEIQLHFLECLGLQTTCIVHVCLSICFVHWLTESMEYKRLVFTQ
jgi:hypothetical protein